MRLLVCGGRDFTNRCAMIWGLNCAVGRETNVTLIHGGARGADTLAGEIAKAAGVPVLVFPADWEKHGRRAGYLRNKQMLEEGRPDLVVAFPGGAGTRMMIELALAAGVRTIGWRPKDLAHHP